MSDRRAAARPRPVADAPVAELTAAAPELSKRWLMALIASADLGDAARLPVAELAREAPALIVALVRSLASDADLASLAPHGEAAALAARAGRLGGARDPGEAVRAVEALRVVLWDALLDELRGAGPAQVGELAARLGHATAEVAAAAAGAGPAEAPNSAALPADAAWSPSPGFSPPAADGPPPMGDLAADRALSDLRPGDPDVADPVIPFAAPPTIPGPRAAIGNVPDEGPAAWIGSIGRRLERFAEDRRPFAAMLIEIADIDRLRHALEAGDLSTIVGAVETALSGELRPADVLTREGPGRYWLVTPETDAEGARLLAERLARAVHAGAEHRGAPLQVAIGMAVCPDDGHEAAALAARADVGVYAARAAGRATAPADVS
jgi:diguanylate cyclase (GGDEF)-like protein